VVHTSGHKADGVSCFTTVAVQGVFLKIILAHYRDLIYDLCRWPAKNWCAVVIGNMTRVSAPVPYFYV